MGPREIAKRALVVTLLIEGVTALMRFGFRLESTRDTASTIGAITGGIRIHHGYIGILAVALGAAFWSRLRPVARAWILIIGLALVASDLVHHFVVLWIVVGDPQFDLRY